MPENPYQPPQEVNESGAKRQRLVLGLLGGLTVPAATIAGSTVCTAVARMPTFVTYGNVWVAIAVGVAASFGVLVASDWYKRRQTTARNRPGYFAAAMGMALTAPFALALLFGGGSLIANSPLELSWALSAGAIVVVAFFLILSLGGWIATGRQRDQDAKQAPRA
jgi:hypothetical protein